MINDVKFVPLKTNYSDLHVLNSNPQKYCHEQDKYNLFD